MRQRVRDVCEVRTYIHGNWINHVDRCPSLGDQQVARKARIDAIQFVADNRGITLGAIHRALTAIVPDGKTDTF